MNQTIEIQNMSMKFKNKIIFEDADLTCTPGEIVGIIGENGSGKSVLFKLISGLLAPRSGSIKVNGEQIANKDIYPDDVGILIEEPPFIKYLTGLDNLKLLASIKNTISEDTILEVMKSVGLIEQKNLKTEAYSLGMKKKLGIAQAIMENQRVLLMDEPMNALDVESVKIITELFHKKRKEGCTILITSHRPEEIDSLCNRVYKIQDFKLIEM